MQNSKRYILLLPFWLLTFIGCTNNGKKDSALRDTVTQEYLKTIDSSGQYDTSEINYKILKAYISNDTTFFNQLQKDIYKTKQERANWDLWNKDIPLPKLQDLNIEEAYRFIFSMQAAPTYHVVTITKKGDSVNLRFALCRKDFDSNITNIVSQSDKRLEIAEWNELIDKLKYADFWGLKKESGTRGTDGSDLTVIGYIKGKRADGVPDKYNFVHRFWTSTLNDAFFYVYFNLLDKKYRPYQF